MGFGSFVGAADDVFDPNRAAQAGTDPAQLHEWFHAGPGTGSYQRAAEALRPVVGDMKNYPNHLIQAQQALAAALPDADAALGQLRAAAQQIAAHAEGLHAGLTAQISQFNDAQAKIVPVPATPPAGPGLREYVGMITPTGGADVVSADELVAAYQVDARGNQQAYRAYQRPTEQQTSALPQGNRLPLPPPAQRPPAQPPLNRPPTPPHDGPLPNRPPTPPHGSALVARPLTPPGDPLVNRPPTPPPGDLPVARPLTPPPGDSPVNRSPRGDVPVNRTATPPQGNPAPNRPPQSGAPVNLPSTPPQAMHRPATPPQGSRPPAPHGNPVNRAPAPPNGYGAPGPGRSYPGGVAPSRPANGYTPPKATAVSPMNSYGSGDGFGPTGGFGPSGPATSGYRNSVGPTAAELAGERGMAELRSGRRLQDRDRKSALLQENNTDDLFGTDEKTVPPVIGG
ncbi:MAG TPA: hypothetical protein VJ914_19995 [Pseudonocardiaceae bacterium]|nr:hypothetical protein [Pseudonocardiaceae bacterium]